MTVYILLTIVTVLTAAFVRKRQPEYTGAYIMTRQQACNAVCLLTLFALLFGVSACRYQVGNDYGRYEEFFHLIPLHQVVPTEFGFNAIVLAMQFLFGRDTKLTIFALFAFVTVAFMLKAVYDQSEDFLFSFFLFMTLSYYFQSLNTVRYYLAWAVAVFSMKYVLKKQYMKFILLTAAAATIHKSVLLVIPVYLLAAFLSELPRGSKLRRGLLCLLVLGAASGLVFQNLYLKVIVKFYPSYENTSYLDGGTSFINIVRIIGVFLFTLLYYREAVRDNKQNQFYFYLNFFALLLYTCASFVPEISRVGYYMTAGHMFLLPSVVSHIQKERRRKAWKLMITAAAVLYFAVFLVKAQDLLVRIVPYHTWIFPGAV